MIQDTIGLRFFVRGGAFFDAVMTRPQAANILHRYRTGDYRVRGEKMIADEAMNWCLELESVIGIHKFEVQQTPTTPNTQYTRSGI